MTWQRRRRESFNYDVYLSFSKDTLTGFIGYLFHHLDKGGFHTFKDDRHLETEDETPLELPKEIEESRVFIIVLSQKFASSSFCLDKIVHILNRTSSKRTAQLVFPVFYYVDPSDLRRLKGSYGKALAEHEERFKANNENFEHNMDRLQKWKMALRQLADIIYPPINDGVGSVSELTRLMSIVKEVSRYVPRSPIGIKSRVQKVELLLDVESGDGVHMVGICGNPGIGKTTVARAVYDFNAHKFDCSYYLDYVRKISIEHGLVHDLQEMPLSEIVGDKDIKSGSVNNEVSIIKDWLQQKKVLLILDGVDNEEQLEAIVGRFDWFGSGSRVIITTRNEHLLASHGVERRYPVEKLSMTEAFELLSWKAFESGKLEPKYLDFMRRAEAYASGLPFALELIGSRLCGKSIKEWTPALDRYEGIPNGEIQKILRVSYDDLDKDVQELFLKIARSFKECEFAEVERILCPYYGVRLKKDIRELLDKSLIKIDEYGHVTLHDLIQDMVRQQLEDPGEHGRLQLDEAIVPDLEESTEYGEREIQDASDDRSKAWDLMELKYQVSHNQSIIRKKSYHGQWQFCLCDLISSVVSLCSSSSSLAAP